MNTYFLSKKQKNERMERNKKKDIGMNGFYYFKGTVR